MASHGGPYSPVAGYSDGPMLSPGRSETQLATHWRHYLEVGVMNSLSPIVIRSSTLEAAAACIVCGDILAGASLTARYGEMSLRFKCEGCLADFQEDPDRFMPGPSRTCCPDEGYVDAPVSEWMCVR